jgi:hypothetical protein
MSIKVVVCETPQDVAKAAANILATTVKEKTSGRCGSERALLNRQLYWVWQLDPHQKRPTPNLYVSTKRKA